MPQLVTEAVQAAGTATAQSSGVFLIDLITPGWGSSGYYGADILEQAATDKVFHAGMHMYINHQTPQERMDRPSGDLRDLAAVLLEDAVWTGDSLQAKARVFSAWREPLAEMKDSIGTSIRAAADVEYGEAEGRAGKIIGRIVHAESVDFVTKPGRGGRIVDVLESERIEEARNIGQWIESRIHRDFTITADDMAGDGRLTRDERIGLSAAIGDALAAFVARLEADQPQLYSRDLWEEPTDTIATAVESFMNFSASPAGNHQESKEDTMPEIEEARLRQLETDAGRVTVLESERDTAISERDEARSELAEARAATRTATVARVIAEADAQFTDLEVSGLNALAEQHTTDGVLNEDAFTSAVTEAAAAKAVAEGAGSVRGNGQRTTSVEKASLADLDESLDATFGGPITQEA